MEHVSRKGETTWDIWCVVMDSKTSKAFESFEEGMVKAEVVARFDKT